jgi:hypothetical protein
MKAATVLAGLALLAAPVALAKDAPGYEKGALLAMDSAKCGVNENGGKTMTAEILGGDSAHRKSHEVLCQDYTLQSEHITYRIRPADEKHPILLPVGESVEFRIHKGKMFVLASEVDHKEHQYTVLSMQIRQDVKAARDAQPAAAPAAAATAQPSAPAVSAQ